MLARIRQLATDLHFEFVRIFRTHHVTKVLKQAHKIELAQTPLPLWPTTIQRHRQEIASVRAGNFEIIDRKSIAYPFLPSALSRLEQPLVKPEPLTLKKFAETPIPRRAINLIKNAVLKLDWKIVLNADFKMSSEIEKRIQIVTRTLQKPNNDATWKALMEPVLEDTIVGGYGCIEPEITPYYKRPFKLWAVDGSSIMLYANWRESEPDAPRYAQRTLQGEHDIINFRDDELIYIRDNIRSFTPFGLGKLEVAFKTVAAFLAAQESAANAGAEPVKKSWLWWKKAQTTQHLNTVSRQIEFGGEGNSSYSFMSGIEVPEVVKLDGRTEADLMIGWQEFLIRIIAQAFDLSPLALGLERDVNRNTGEVMSLQDFNSSTLPMARRIEEHVTHDILHDLLHWNDLEFEFIGLDDPDMLTKLDIMTKMDALDALVPDEVREDFGRPPITGGYGKLTRTQRAILQQEAQLKLSGAIQKSQQEAQQQHQQELADKGQGFGLPPVPGGFKPGGGPAGGGAKTPPVPKPPMPPKPGAKVPGVRVPMQGSMFSAYDVAEMDAAKIQSLQEMNLLPKTAELKQRMQEQEPDIFIMLSDELRKFFEYADKNDAEIEVKPEQVSPADEKLQDGIYKQNLKRKKSYEAKDKNVFHDVTKK